MDEYSVTWGIEVDADSPRDAAIKALEALTSDDPGSVAQVFLVEGPNGKDTIDLSPGAGTEDVDLSTDRDAPWVITAADGSILDRFVSEEARDDALHTGGYPDDAEPAFVNDLAAVLTVAVPEDVRERLEYLRGELRGERISQGELIELQGLAEYIEPGDVELLEPAGVPEFPEDAETPEGVVADMLTRDDASAADIAAAAIEAHERSMPGPRTYTMTMTPEAEAALAARAAEPAVYVEGTILVQYDGMRTPDDVGNALVEWLLRDAVTLNDEVTVNVRSDGRAPDTSVEVRPRDVLREHMIAQAAGLLDQSPGHVEYVRALTELTCRVLGISTDEKGEIRDAIMRRVTD